MSSSCSLVNGTTICNPSKEKTATSNPWFVQSTNSLQYCYILSHFSIHQCLVCEGDYTNAWFVKVISSTEDSCESITVTEHDSLQFFRTQIRPIKSLLATISFIESRAKFNQFTVRWFSYRYKLSCCSKEAFHHVAHRQPFFISYILSGNLSSSDFQRLCSPRMTS